MVTSTEDVPSTSNRQIRPGTAALPILLVIFAAILRIWNFPHLQETRDLDELMYVPNGLMAWEGLAPAMRTGPSGPQTWLGWFYAAGRSGWEFVQPGQKLPSVLKPFTAIEQALFKTYEDLSGLRLLLLWISLLISLAAVFGAYHLGARYGNATGGLLIGGLVAVLPLFVEYSAIAKSSSDGWMLAILAVSCAATMSKARRYWLSGILLGLAVGSRIDMLQVAPLVLWALWDSHEEGPLWKPMLVMLTLTLVCALLSAPWMAEAFVGMLRNIAMSRVAGYWNMESPRLTTLKNLLWDQGLGPVLVATIVGLFLLPVETRRRRGVLALIAALMLATIFGKRYMYMRYYGGPLIAIFTCAAVTVGVLFERWPKLTAPLTALLLALPLVQSVRLGLTAKALYAAENSAEWIDAHVPPGTTVYLDPRFVSRAILPTEASADAIWRLLADNDPWRFKLQDGFRRFSLPDGHLPRAMSEDNLVMDRALLRRWFILGGGRSERPRYNIRLLPLSPTLRLLDGGVCLQDFKKTGGVLVRRFPADAGDAVEGLGALGEPFVKWMNEKGKGTMIYVSPDLREKLKPGP